MIKQRLQLEHKCISSSRSRWRIILNFSYVWHMGLKLNTHTQQNECYILSSLNILHFYIVPFLKYSFATPYFFFVTPSMVVCLFVCLLVCLYICLFVVLLFVCPALIHHEVTQFQHLYINNTNTKQSMQKKINKYLIKSGRL